MTEADRNLTPVATSAALAASETSSLTSLAFAPLLRHAASVSQALEDEVREAAGRLPETLSLEERCPVSAWYAAWEALERGCRDNAVAVRVAEASDLADLEIFGFLAMTARSLEEAFARVARVRALWAEGAGWSLGVDPAGEGAQLRYHPWADEVDRRGRTLATEFVVAEMLQSVRQLVGERIVPIRVGFHHLPLQDERALGAFFGVAPTFTPERAGPEGYEATLTLPASIGARQVSAFDTRLHAFFLRECDAMMERLGGQDTWLTLLRRKIADAHSYGQPSAQELAKGLGMSPRSLRRRLEERGTSFRAIKEEVSVNLANAYLAREGLSASEVAFLMGFAEPSAFFRAYRRWTGETPGEFQTRRRAG